MSDEAERQTQEITHALGAAMANWGEVENQIYLVYCALCLPGSFPNTHSVIYETVVHLDTKLAIIEALLEFKLKENDPLLEQWAALQKKIKRRIKNVRNKLAHWRVYRVKRGDTLEVFLGPPLHVESHKVPDFGTSHGGYMKASDLLGHAKSFRELAFEIRNFVHALLPGKLPRTTPP